MKVANKFSLRRFAKFTFLDFQEDSKSYIVSLSVIAAIFGSLSFLMSAINNSTNYNSQNAFLLISFIPTLLISGSIVSSNIFESMHRKNRVQQWFALPVSDFEKFASKLLISLVLWPLLLLLVFSTVLNLVELISLGINGSNNGYFNPFTSECGYGLLVYYMIQPIFFAGGAYFKKLNWLKTVLVYIAFSIFALIVVALSGFLVGVNFLNNNTLIGDLISQFTNPYNSFSEAVSVNGDIFYKVFSVEYILLKVYFFGLLQLGLWGFSWFCVKENEVKDAI